MDRLWVRLSIAITVVILFALASTTALLYIGPLLIPAEQNTEDAAVDLTLRQVDLDLLVQTLKLPDFEQRHLVLYSDGYFVFDGLTSQAAFDLIVQRLPDLNAFLDNDELAQQNEPTSEQDTTAKRSFYLEGQIARNQIDSFAQALPDTVVERTPDPFLTSNLSLSDLIQLLGEQIWQAIAISIILGIGLGVLVSRTLTSPLRHLSEAAQAIGAKNLSQRVQISGSREVTELAQTFNQMASDLERAELLRRQMMADVSHELRTPLAGLESNLRAALDQVHTLEEADLAQLYSQTRHLIHLVNDLHEISLAEAGQLPLKRAPTNLIELIGQTVAFFEPLAEEKSISLEQVLPDTMPAFMLDERRLRQVLHNLLGNAMRHTPAGGTIRVSMLPSENACQIIVKDSGEGISAEHLPYIFERFYRSDTSRSRDIGGTGLGLSIAKAIIEAHGGSLSASSAGLGHGSSFIITLNQAGRE